MAQRIEIRVGEDAGQRTSMGRARTAKYICKFIETYISIKQNAERKTERLGKRKTSRNGEGRIKQVRRITHPINHLQRVFWVIGNPYSIDLGPWNAR
jgi:hypothetical protein